VPLGAQNAILGGGRYDGPPKRSAVRNPRPHRLRHWRRPPRILTHQIRKEATRNPDVYIAPLAQE